MDFDFLSPDFPERAPGLLLQALADPLRAHAAVEGEMRTLDVQAADLVEHESLRGDPLAWGPGTPSGALLAQFVRVLGALPAQVVLMLDTCEELERLEGRAEGSLALRALLAMMEELLTLAAGGRGHLQGLRIVFSGRRPLADSGGTGKHAWDLPAEQRLGRGTRPWLRMHRVLGLDLEEARAFVSERLERHPERLGDVLEASRPRDEGGRYLPFDLAMLRSGRIRSHRPRRPISSRAWDGTSS